MNDFSDQLSNYDLRETELEEPTNEDWEELEKKTKFIFPDDFKDFFKQVRKYYFEGELPSFSGRVSDGIDWFDLIDRERNQSENPIPVQLIPFCGVGNGDYHCFHITDAGSRTFNIVYWYAEEYWEQQLNNLHILTDDFTSWLNGYVQDEY